MLNQELEEAARAAQILDFVRALPRQWDTPIEGVHVSGGQKQRLAVARALVRKELEH